MECKWHECRKEFAPDHPRQKFCCLKCQRARGSWKERRGAVLVDMLIEMDAVGLASERKKLLTEVGL